MTKHRSKQQQKEQPIKKEKGWFCFEHSIKWLCEKCGYDSNKKGEDTKYYFVS